MPNGELEKYYGNRVLKAGKNPDKARFNIKLVNKFELLKNNPSRIKIIYFNDNLPNNIRKKLSIYEDIYKNNE